MRFRSLLFVSSLLHNHVKKLCVKLTRTRACSYLCIPEQLHQPGCSWIFRMTSSFPEFINHHLDEPLEKWLYLMLLEKTWLQVLIRATNRGGWDLLFTCPVCVFTYEHVARRKSCHSWFLELFKFIFSKVQLFTLL